MRRVLEITVGVVLANVVNAVIAGLIRRHYLKKRGAALQEQFAKLLAETPGDPDGELPTPGAYI